MEADADFPRGPVLEGWTPPPFPDAEMLRGRHVRLEAMTAAHLEPLHEVLHDAPERDWFYMPMGPFSGPEAFRAWGRDRIAAHDPRFYVIRDGATGRPGGFLSLLNIAPAHGTIEIGFIQMAPHMQRSVGATEAIWLLMDHAFALGYRRVEWKCDALNRRSRRAAQRLGFSFEGVFRQARVVKGRNRDTAWFAAIDREWPKLAEVFARWFAGIAGDGDGRQTQRLSEMTAPLLHRRDPLSATDE